MGRPRGPNSDNIINIIRTSHSRGKTPPAEQVTAPEVRNIEVCRDFENGTLCTTRRLLPGLNLLIETNVFNSPNTCYTCPDLRSATPQLEVNAFLENPQGAGFSEGLQNSKIALCFETRSRFTIDYKYKRVGSGLVLRNPAVIHHSTAATHNPISTTLQSPPHPSWL